MTTLFNLFCPLVFLHVKMSVLFLTVSSIFISTLIMMLLMNKPNISLSKLSEFLFPSASESFLVYISLFLTLSLLNLSSLISFSYPVTTTLSFNLIAAFIFWSLSIIIVFNKKNSFSSLLPVNSPWYLVPFLGLVELVSISVRPITLCFRLLANMSAGHILLSLICKLSYVWSLGVLFGLLELMVSVVQSFVFVMLINVYYEESLTH